MFRMRQLAESSDLHYHLKATVKGKLSSSVTMRIWVCSNVKWYSLIYSLINKRQGTNQINTCCRWTLGLYWREQFPVIDRKKPLMLRHMWILLSLEMPPPSFILNLTWLLHKPSCCFSVHVLIGLCKPSILCVAHNHGGGGKHEGRAFWDI